MQPSKLKNIDVAIKLRQVIGFYLTPYYIEFAGRYPRSSIDFSIVAALRTRSAASFSDRFLMVRMALLRANGYLERVIGPQQCT